MGGIGWTTGCLHCANRYISLAASVKFENYAKAKEAGAALGYGLFLNNVIDFVIISFVVFMITKALLRATAAPAGPAL
mgnify:CR=1 FL=1